MTNKQPDNKTEGSQSGQNRPESVHSDKIKFVGLIVFIAITVLVTILIWPYISEAFTEGGVERIIERVQSAGPLGVLILLGMQLLQIIVAFIPGEVVQVAAGMMYGPWLGALIILVGCVISSAIIYKLVDTLGAPFVKDMVSDEHIDKFEKFEQAGKLDIVVFILFLIPAMPKDVFTYLVPLTSMPMNRFLLLSNIGRFPGILASTFVAAGIVDGHIGTSIAVAVVVGVIALVVVVFRDRMMN